MPARKVIPNGEVAQQALQDLSLRRYVLNKMNASLTAREMGVSHTTIKRWWEDLSPDEKQAYIDDTKEDVASAWRAIEDAATFELMKRIPGAKTHDLAVIAGVAADKAMKYMGVADNMNITLPESADDIATQIQAIIKGAKQRDVNTKREAALTLPA